MNFYSIENPKNRYYKFDIAPITKHFPEPYNNYFLYFDNSVYDLYVEPVGFSYELNLVSKAIKTASLVNATSIRRYIFDLNINLSLCHGLGHNMISIAIIGAPYPTDC